MDEQLKKLEVTTSELENIIKEELEILKKATTSAKGYLQGQWKQSDNSQWTSHDVKIKVDGFHLLLNLWSCQNEKRVSVSLQKSTIIDRKKNKFQNNEIANNWTVARNHVTLEQVVDGILTELEKNLRDAKKQNLQDISHRIDKV